MLRDTVPSACAKLGKCIPRPPMIAEKLFIASSNAPQRRLKAAPSP